MDWDSMILGKMVESIQSHLPDTRDYSGEAYIQLVDRVIDDLFGSKVEDAVQRAQDYLCWNEETEQWNTFYS